MRYRKLRIAWSVACAIACLLLIALWVRSKYAADSFYGPIGRVNGFVATSRDGGLGIGISDSKLKWLYVSRQPNAKSSIEYSTVLGFSVSQSTFPIHRSARGLVAFRTPHWFPVLSFATLSALPWFRYRFSLRTLLIATTLVAVVLGLIVYATR
jgi:hypothetical protein